MEICENLMAAAGKHAASPKDGKAAIAEAAAKAEFGKAIGIKASPALANALKTAGSKDIMVDAAGKEATTGTPLVTLIEANDNSIKKLLVASPEMKLAYKWSGDVEKSLEQGTISQEDAAPVQNAIDDYKEKPTKEKFKEVSARQFYLFHVKLKPTAQSDKAIAQNEP